MKNGHSDENSSKMSLFAVSILKFSKIINQHICATAEQTLDISDRRFSEVEIKHFIFMDSYAIGTPLERLFNFLSLLEFQTGTFKV